MKLYVSPGACSMASHITLHELGLQAEVIRIDKANKPPEFARLNPMGYIPLLVTDGGEPLSESSAILQFLADQKPEKNMFPRAGTWERYKGLEMLNFVATEVYKNFSVLWGLGGLLKEDGAKAEFKAAMVKKLGARFDRVEEILKKQSFLMGEQFTICDAYLFTVTNWTKVMNIDMAKWSKTLGYMERIQMRPAAQTAMKAEGLLK